MKTINYKKIILPIIAFVAFMLYLNSCKKTDDLAPVSNIDAESTRAKAIQAIKAKYGNVSAGYIVNVNKTADEIFYKNAAGKMVSLYNNGNYNPQGTNIVCIFTCNNTSNPANLHITYTLDYVQRQYICESNGDKSTLSVKWTVSAPFAITNETPDGVLNTFGKVKFTPSVGAAVILTATANDPGFTVTNLGTDPNCAVNTLYAVTYSFTRVDNSNFASGTQLDALLSLSNDCALIGYLSATSYVSAPSFNQSAYLPCNRIERVYVNPAQTGNPTTTAAGNYILCTPPGGLTPIDNHQLEYRKVTATNGSLKWDDQPSSTSTVYWGVPIGSSPPGSAVLNPYTGVSTLVNMTIGSGTWLVRFRNVNTSSCPTITPINSGWGNNWVTEVWPL